MENKSFVTLFIDDDPQPIGTFPAPVSFELDTKKLTDGRHTLKVVSKDHKGKEGIKTIPFIVRNGPAIAVEGLRKDEVVDGKVDDAKRVTYLYEYLQQVLKAKNEGSKVDGYFIWTLTDNFEWAEGYHPRFGIIHVDFETQQRIIKSSGQWYGDLLK